MYFRRVFFVTRKMEIKYVKPVSIGTNLTVSARILDASKPPKLNVRGEIRDDQGRLLVASSGEFVELPKERLPLISEGSKGEMLTLFDQFKGTR
jgi:acyl-CoA thioesterase FadM